MSLFSRGVGVGLTGASMLSGNAKAVLIPESIGMPVMFSFNPDGVSMEKTAKTEGNRGVVDSPFKDALKAVGNTRLKLSGAHLTGALTTQWACQQLIDWATPTTDVGILGTLGNMGAALGSAMGSMRSMASGGLRGLAGAAMSSVSSTRKPNILGYGGVNSTYKLPVLLFMWGVGGPMGTGTKVNLEQVKIKYRRFDWTGVPVWAEVDLTLVEYVEGLPGQNPTSGSIAGRAKHTVTAGESVVRIAQQSYGTPTAWRAVAEANKLDDPLRVKPGKLLDLPAPSELALEGAAT